jgi:hypothetical protein
VLLCLGLLFAFAGCASEEHEAAGPGRHRRPPPTPLAGQENYFDGKIGVAIIVGALEGPGIMPGDGEGSEKRGGGRRRGGGMSMGMGGEGGGRRHEGGYGGTPGSEHLEGVRPMRGSMETPQMIHLKFTNHGTEKATVDIVDFVSPLGNFAVQPEKLTLEPGQTVEPEPMSSQLTGSLTAADATLVLRFSGKSEKKLVSLRAVTPTPAAPPPEK